MATNTKTNGRERLGRAGAAAREIATREAGHLAEVGQKTVAQARRKPLSSALIVAGAVVGGALLLNPALRRVAIAAGPSLWKMIQKRRAAAA